MLNSVEIYIYIRWKSVYYDCIWSEAAQTGDNLYYFPIALAKRDTLNHHHNNRIESANLCYFIEENVSSFLKLSYILLTC